MVRKDGSVRQATELPDETVGGAAVMRFWHAAARERRSICQASQVFAGTKRRRDRAVIKVVQLAPDRHPLSQRSNRDPVFKKVCDVVRGGLPIDRGVQGKDDLGHLFGGDTVDKFRNAKVLGAHGIKGRKRPANLMSAGGPGQKTTRPRRRRGRVFGRSDSGESTRQFAGI